MKKQITKIFSIFIILFLALTTNVNAATAITVNSDIKGTTDPNSSYITNQSMLTITNVVAGDSFKAYKVLDAYYNQSTNVITYEFTPNFKTFLSTSTAYKDLTVEQYYELTSGNITSGSTKTTSTLDKLASAYAGYIKNNAVTGLDMVVNGTTATLTADAGTYLVLPSLTNQVYAVMVGNLDFTATTNEWTLNNATIVAKVSKAGITKSVGTSGYQEGSFIIGESFTYSLVATTPTYPTNATNKKYTLIDTLSTGLTFDGLSTITVKAGTTTFTTAATGVITNASGNTVATATYANQKLTIDFNLDYIDATRIEIEYKAHLNENAVLGDAGNVNSVSLTYSNDPYGTGTYTTDPTESEATAYTYGLELFLYDQEDNTPLSGAVFEIYKDAALTEKVGTITTDANGLAIYKGLSAETYYLKQTTAPTGYTLIRDAIETEITPEGNGATTGIFYTRKDVPSSKVGLLPSTGGVGTIIFTVIGLLFIVVAIIFIIVYRKKKNNKEQSKK